MWIRLTPQEPGHPYPATFGIILDYGDPAYVFYDGYHYVDSMRFGLEAAGVRRALFNRTLQQGRYGARAHFNADTTARVEFEAYHNDAVEVLTPLPNESFKLPGEWLMARGACSHRYHVIRHSAR